MTTILLTGIPKSGKTDLIQKTQQLLRDSMEQEVGNISLGNLVAEEAHRLWNTPLDRIHKVDAENQQALRDYAIAETAYRLATSQTPSSIVDTPMSMCLQNGNVYDTIFNHGQIEKLAQAAKGIEYIVTLIDDPEEMSRKLENTSYPSEIPRILDWTAQEVGITRATRPITAAGKTSRYLVIPKEHSDTTLAKLLVDPNPPILYLGFPITHLEKDARKEVINFISQMQEYAAIIVPMTIADQRVGEEKERENTIYRDKHWFATDCDMFGGFFPRDVLSLGWLEEFRKTQRTGKPSFLIRPSRKDKKKETFNVDTTLKRYDSPEEFFAAIAKSRDSKYDNTPNALLRRFLDPSQKEPIPRYANLQPFAVAAVIQNQQGQFLLGRQAQGKKFEGHYTPVTGKREVKDEKLETVERAIQREAWEEVGVRLHEISSDFQIHPTDYGNVKYVRFYRAQHDGQPRADNSTTHPELEDLKWMTRAEILSGKHKIMPATQNYFKNLEK